MLTNYIRIEFVELSFEMRNDLQGLKIERDPELRDLLCSWSRSYSSSAATSPVLEIISTSFVGSILYPTLRCDNI